jgi:hypothetical protein
MKSLVCYGAPSLGRSKIAQTWGLRPTKNKIVKNNWISSHGYLTEQLKSHEQLVLWRAAGESVHCEAKKGAHLYENNELCCTLKD